MGNNNQSNLRPIDKARTKSLELWIGSPKHIAQIRALGHARTKHLSSRAYVTTPTLAYIVGVLMGDGSLYKGNTIYLGAKSTDKEFVAAFSRAIHDQFGIGTSLRLKHDKRNGTCLLVCTAHSKLAYNFLLRVKTTKWVDTLSRKSKIAWLRGMWDSEGWVDVDATSPVVGFAITSRSIASKYARVVEEVLGTRPYLHRYVYQYKNRSGAIWYVRFYGASNATRFYDMVQPTIHRKCLAFERLGRQV